MYPTPPFGSLSADVLRMYLWMARLFIFRLGGLDSLIGDAGRTGPFRGFWLPVFALLADFLIRHRRTTMAVTALSAIAASLIASRLEYDFTPQALFAGQDEVVKFNELVKQTFGHSDNVVVAVQLAEGEEDLLTPKALRWHRRLCQRLAQVPAVIRIDALETLRAPRPRLLSSSLKYVPIIRPGPIDQEEAELVRRKVADQPLINGVLVSRDRRAVAVVLHLDPSNKSISHLHGVIGEIEQAIHQVGMPSGYAAFVGGLPAMRVAIVDGLKADQTTIIPLCVVLFAVVQALIFHRWTAVLVSTISVVIGLAWTMAALVLLGQSLTIISNVLPILLMIVGVSSCVHFLNGYAEFFARQPDNPQAALRATISQLSLACFLTSLTTALGFLSLLAARSEVLGAMGWQAALGIVLFYVATVLVCGTILPIYRPTVGAADSTEPARPSRLARVAQSAGNWAMEHAVGVAVGSFLLMAAAGWIGSHAEIDSQLIETFDADHPQVIRMRLIEDQLGGFVPFEIVLQADASHWYRDARQWRSLVAAHRFAKEQPGVLLVRSPLDYYAEVDRHLPGPSLVDLASAVDDSELTSRIRQIGRQLDRLARSGEIRRFTTSDGQQVRISLHLRDLGTRRGQQLAESLQQKLQQLFPDEGPVRARVTGEYYVAAVSLNRFISDLLYSLFGVSLLIFVVIGGVLRSPRLGLISIAPNVAPLVITLGYLQLRGYSLNMGNVIVFAISLGVAVDDTIHFLARFRTEAENESDVTAAIRRTCVGTGRAVLMTTLLIVTGLVILLLSSFVPTRRFAELTAVTMISALLGDLLVLPALLKIFWAGQGPAGAKTPAENASR
ncbi:MMPL family transporter [Pirellulales bacterium]|nr:MMPL family transporter [Pirellulales bacterium]